VGADRVMTDPFRGTSIVLDFDNGCSMEMSGFELVLIDHSNCSLAGLIIFRMLGANVDCSGILISAVWMHISPLAFSVGMCILVLPSGTSGRVIPLI